MERRALDQGADSREDVGTVRRHRVTEQLDAAGRGPDQTEQHANRRRLPRAIGAEKTVDRPCGDDQIEAVDSDLMSEAFGEARGGDGDLRHQLPSAA